MVALKDGLMNIMQSYALLHDAMKDGIQPMIKDFQTENELLSRTHFLFA